MDNILKLNKIIRSQENQVYFSHWLSGYFSLQQAERPHWTASFTWRALWTGVPPVHKILLGCKFKYSPQCWQKIKYVSTYFLHWTFFFGLWLPSLNPDRQRSIKGKLSDAVNPFNQESGYFSTIAWALYSIVNYSE